MSLQICPERQRILDENGHLLVTGGPGAGKTTIALLKARKRIEEGLLPGQSVLFLSFSRAAVGRVMEASQKEVPKVIRNRLSVQTFHSFFWEIIRGHGYLLGAPRRLRLLLPHDEDAARHEYENVGLDWNVERERRFREEGSVAFDLFAPKALELLMRSQRLRSLLSSRFPLIVVDEAQDTAEDQWAIAKLMAQHSQLMCLADLDQQIYDFRPGVSSERVEQIMETLHPLRVDLQTQNHRSPNCEIVQFGNDVLLGTPRGSPYIGVSRLNFHPRRDRRDVGIRQSIGMSIQRVEQLTGKRPKSIALFATWGRGVNLLTRALTGDGGDQRIPHRVFIDEAPVLLSSRVVAFLMEPRRSTADELLELADGLELCAAVYRSKGGGGNLDQASRLSVAATQAQGGAQPRRNTVSARLLQVLRTLRSHSFSGEPRSDWLDARRFLADCGANPLAEIARYAEQLAAFQRGQRIARALTELWQTRGHYHGARIVLDDAISAEQLLSGGNDLAGIHVMTAHKSKSKEFDAVVIFDDPNSSPLIYCKEIAPYRRSRKLARVAITRARHHVLMLTDASRPSILLNGHRL
ncbi:MAG: UvrD-helicase domain-containing protein [Bacillota bacterium]